MFFIVHRHFFIMYCLLITASVHVAADAEDQQKNGYLGEDSAMDKLQSLFKSIGSNELPHIKNEGDEYKDPKNNNQPEINIEIYNISKITLSPPIKSGKHYKVDRIEEVLVELLPEFQQMQSRSGRFLISSDNTNYVLNRHRRDEKNINTSVTCGVGSGCCSYNSKSGEKTYHPPRNINTRVTCSGGSTCCFNVNSTSGLKNKILKYIILFGLFVGMSIPQTL